jgi:myo-inositol-1(or 4)-monophosphatase
MNQQIPILESDKVVASADLRAIEQMCIELANLAGAEIVTALGGILAVRYKTRSPDETTWRDPVSEVDHRVETLIRARLAERYPEHDIIGEEIDERPGRNHEFLWAVDPIDGTANFVNGFPLFAASIGVLHHGRPIAGAIWCSSSHRLRPGVYHAHIGGALYFDNETAEPRLNPAVRRRLAGAPDCASDGGPWDVRKTGSAAIECALVAAGLLQVARFEQPNIWDVAGGTALVLAAGGEVLAQSSTGWSKMDRFQVKESEGPGDLRNWHQRLVLGRAESVATMCDLSQATGGTLSQATR